jgi:DNA repair protein RadD
MKSGHLCGRENLLNQVCYEASIRELIVEGYLCGLISKSGRPASIADTSKVHIRGGEFVPGELEDAMADDGVVNSAVDEIIHYSEDRNKCLIFTCGIEHGNMVTQKLSRRTDKKVEFIHGETPAMLRKFALEEFKDPGSDLKFIVNVNIFTEGFDAPNIDTIALLRATQSPGLFAQMCGRGFRPHPSKETCLVLDYGENIYRHGPVDAIRPTAGSEGDSPPPMKTCPECSNVDYAGMKLCTQCGYEYPFEETTRGKHTREGSEEGILSDQVKREWLKVESVSYREHTKRDAPEGHPKTLRVDYRTGFGSYVSEWICVEHDPGSYPRGKAEMWWFRRTGIDFPDNAESAANTGEGRLLREPTYIEIMTKPGDRFPSVCGARFADDEPPEEIETTPVLEEKDIPF